jgi:hypothetical protein
MRRLSSLFQQEAVYHLLLKHFQMASAVVFTVVGCPYAHIESDSCNEPSTRHTGATGILVIGQE